MLNEVISHIESVIGQKIVFQKSVHGGDIAQAYKLVDEQNQAYFLKYLQLNNGLFDAEQSGLKRLSQANSSFQIPTVYVVSSNPSYLLLQWLDMAASAIGNKQSYNAGKALAALHNNTSDSAYFGLNHDNFIGSIAQPNNQKDDWFEFYYENRGAKQLQIGIEKGLFSSQDLRYWAKMVNIYQNELPRVEKPALLHGDLWSGNMAYHPTDEKVSYLYDPAVYYGHPEMDLAMTKLFGGFSPSFYQGYQDDCTADISGWEKRLDFHQFYPLLIHALLFGGGYVNQVKDLLKKYGT